MNILVTGGAGFIGANFIKYWLNKYPEDKVINLDKLTYAGNLDNVADIQSHKNYRFIYGDICDEKLVDSLMEQVDTVVHFAAETHVDRSIENPDVFLQTNLLGTGMLLRLAKKHGIKRFHYVSTDEVFGSLSLTSKEKFNESTVYDPRSPYSASKAGSDHLVRSYFYTFGLPITITNCSNNFGPYMGVEKFIPRAVTDVIDNKPIKIYGDGKYIRDWLYVEDHCRAIDLVLHNGIPGETYVVGGQDKMYSNLEVAKMILNILGKPKDMITFVKDRPGHDRKYAVDWSKINKELKWSPNKTFPERLSETVQWYNQNQSYWRPLKKEIESFYEKIKR